MYRSPYNPKFIIPDMEKYHCNHCGSEFILSVQYDNRKAVCPYCRSNNIEARTRLEDPDLLDGLGCLAIPLGGG